MRQWLVQGLIIASKVCPLLHGINMMPWMCYYSARFHSCNFNHLKHINLLSFNFYFIILSKVAPPLFVYFFFFLYIKFVITLMNRWKLKYLVFSTHVCTYIFLFEKVCSCLWKILALHFYSSYYVEWRYFL